MQPLPKISLILCVMVCLWACKSEQTGFEPTESMVLVQRTTPDYLFLNYHLRRCYLQSRRISRYDDAIKRYAGRLNWDWRLLAALIYQESSFSSVAVSPKGAFGLMQLMPFVAEKYGITEESSPEEQILAGVKHLQSIYRSLPSDIPESERIPFTIAAYNVGLGHILDARRLAILYDKDPNIWFDNVELTLLKKSNPAIIRDSVVRHGFARGEETYNLVRNVFTRWQQYQDLVK